MNARPLIDPQGRQVTYLRMSVTDRCDLRCHYCLPLRPAFLPKKEVLSLEELLLAGRIFVALGVRKIRITGGEPLIRRDLCWLLERLAALEGLDELVLTTNGTRLAELGEELARIKVRRLNISLDTLRPATFRQITRNGELGKVLAGIEAACSAGFSAIRLNTVLMRGINDGEIGALVGYALSLGVDICFIEEMPMGETDRARPRRPFTAAELLEALAGDYALTASSHHTGGPAQYFSVAGHRSKIGVIAPHTRNFCASCNRVRLTCTGQLYPCLGHMGGASLRRALQDGDEAEVERLIRSALARKPHGHEFDMQAQTKVLRYMAVTGG